MDVTKAHRQNGQEIGNINGRSSSEVRSAKVVLSLILFCLLGLAVSVELARIHVFVHTDPSYHSVCAMSEEVNCETVPASPYSVFAGLPVAIWGAVGYLFMVESL